MANYSTREIPGVGPVTKEGMPISLRSEAKEHNQSDWYKQVYNTIHKPHGDDGFLTVRYKTRRGGATHKANGYMSEPEHGYESDYTYNSDAYSGITPQKPPGSYKMNPGRIEDYSPGQYQEPEKPRSTSTRPARTAAYTQGNLSRALKETGYESDNSFIVRKKGPLASAPSPEYQKQAYLHVQAGGEPPLQGFRKQLSAHPKDENAAEGTAAVPPPPPPVKAMKMHALDDVYNNKYDDDSSRQYVEGNVNIHYKSPIRQEFKGIIPEDELAEQQAEAMRAIYEQEKRRKQWQELEDLKNRRHTDNFTASQKSPISVHRFDDFVGVEGSAPKPKITTPLAKAKALYDFVGQSSRELTFSQGDIITIHRKVDANWYEGEHNAFCGLFPVDYVELISGAPAPMARAKPSEGLARAKYTFVAQSGIELSLNKGELVALTRQVDENWFEGRIANRKGIIPISYCEVITPIGKKVELPPSVVSTKREEIFIECAPEREMKSSKTEILHVDTSSEPLMYRAVFKYVPQNPDELELFEGDTVLVLEKCDDGWFVGTSERTGCFGTFPGNYVQRI